MSLRTRLADSVSLISFATFVVSALTMVVLWVNWLFQWISWPGLALGVLTAPVGALFPFVHWLVEGSFSAPIFGLWLAGVIGLVVSIGRGVFVREKGAPES